MPDSDPAHLLAALAQELALAPNEQATAAAVTERAIAHVTDADSVSVTLKPRRHRYVTLAASDDLSRRLDQLQYALLEGPCLEAANGHDWCRSGDVGSDRRWPSWGPEARDLGLGSLLSVRLLSAGAPIGALNFYSTRTGQFSDREQVDFAVLYATHVAVALASTRQVTGLETALQSRHVIGIAQGILSERFGLDVARSFDLLRRYSSTTNTRLSTVAEGIVRTRRLPHPVTDPAPPTSQAPTRKPPPLDAWTEPAPSGGEGPAIPRARTSMRFERVGGGRVETPVYDVAQEAIDATATAYASAPSTDVLEHLRLQLSSRGIRATSPESVGEIARQIRSGHHVAVGRPAASGHEGR